MEGDALRLQVGHSQFLTPFGAQDAAAAKIDIAKIQATAAAQSVAGTGYRATAGEDRVVGIALLLLGENSRHGGHRIGLRFYGLGGDYFGRLDRLHVEEDLGAGAFAQTAGCCWLGRRGSAVPTATELLKQALPLQVVANAAAAVGRNTGVAGGP